jgi:hypothetical protein
MTLSVSGDSITFPDLSTQLTAPSGFGFKNRIINGSMNIWQRGTSYSPGGGSAYTADRWFAINTTSVLQRTDTPSSAFLYSAEFLNTSATFPLLEQRIESVNCQDLANQSVTVSLWAKSVSGTSNLYLEIGYPTSLNNFATQVTSASVVLASTLSTTWTQYFATFSLPANVVNGLAIRVVRNNASAATTRVTGVQLEKGSTATAFDYRDYGRELSMCQRYLPVAIIPASNYMYAGQAYGTTNAQVFVPFGVLSRVAPTGITTINSPQFAASAGAPTGSVIMQVGSTSGCSLNASGASGFITGGATSLVTVSAGAAKILFTGCEL